MHIKAMIHTIGAAHTGDYFNQDIIKQELAPSSNKRSNVR